MTTAIKNGHLPAKFFKISESIRCHKPRIARICSPELFRCYTGSLEVREVIKVGTLELQPDDDDNSRCDTSLRISCPLPSRCVKIPGKWNRELKSSPRQTRERRRRSRDANLTKEVYFYMKFILILKWKCKSGGGQIFFFTSAEGRKLCCQPC